MSRRGSIFAVLTIAGGCSNNSPTIEPLPPTSSAASGTASTIAPTTSTTAAAPVTPLEVRMVALKGGTFTMGHDGISPNGELDDARPSHWATVPPFRIDVTEVTVDAYRRCLEAGACSVPVAVKPEPYGHPLPCNWLEPGRGNYPINCVTWYQAETYCRWAGKQLPTEEMWEFAARGKTERGFPWGPDVPNEPWGAPRDLFERLRGACKGLSPHGNDPSTCPVGSAPKGATPEGVLDLAGNVREWTASDYCAYGKKTCDRTKKVARGGDNGPAFSFYINLAYFRADLEPSFASPIFGFRCAKLEKP